VKANKEICTDNLQQLAPATTSSTKPNTTRDAGLKCVIGLLILLIGWLAVKARTDYVTTQQALEGTIELMKDRLPTNLVARETSSIAASR